MGGIILNLAQGVWKTCLKTSLNESLVVPPWQKVATTKVHEQLGASESKNTVTKFHDAS